MVKKVSNDPRPPEFAGQSGRSTIAAVRSTTSREQALRLAVRAPQPVWPTLPASRTFSPLVFLIIAIVPGLYVWFYGTVTAEQAVWGLRGLTALAGEWLRPTTAIDGTAPPVFAWSQAAALAIPIVSPLWLLPLPAYLYGLCSVWMVYRLGRTAFGPGVGLVASFLFGLNQFFLRQMQTGGPETCILAWSLLGLHLYQLHLRNADEVFAPRTVLGMAAFAALFLSSGVFAFWLPLTVGLHLAFLRTPSRMESVPMRTGSAATAFAGMVVVCGGLILAAPWMLTADWSPGPFVPFAGPTTQGMGRAPAALFAALPATIVIGLYGAWRAFRDAVKAPAEHSGAVLLLLWPLVAVLWLRFSAAADAALLLIVAGVTLLAARTLIGILHREMHDRRVMLLMLLASCTFVVCRTPALWNASAWLAGRTELTDRQRFELHLGIDVLVLTAAIIVSLYRYSARRESLRRLLLAAFVLVTVVLAVLPGATQFTGPRRVDDRWQVLFERLTGTRCDRIVVVGANGASRAWTPLHFTTTVLYPGVSREYVVGRTELIQLLSVGDDRYPLVFVTEPAQRLAKSTAITRSGKAFTLSEIYASDQLIAYAADAAGIARPTGLVVGATE